MQLSRLLQGVALTDRIGQEVDVTSLTCDSRTVTPGGLFAAFSGTKEDGSRFIPEALDRGAAAILCAAPPDGPGPWLVTPEPRRAFGQMAANWFGRPGDRMTLVGVTGTNGKTTTTDLLKQVLERVCRTKVGLIGTNQNLVGSQSFPAQRTTPDAYQLQELLARMAAAGCSHVVMEVSSHALALDRTAGLWFRAGIFTNLTQDHLDFHGTMDRYRQAKSRLFHQCTTGIFNQDDPVGAALAQTMPCRRVTFGRREGEVTAREITFSPAGVSFRAETPQGSAPVQLPIPGAFSVSNGLGVLACCLELGLPLAETAQALSQVTGVRGRMEVVPTPAPFTVVIDYAHTPDALSQALTALTPAPGGRRICLFGCGGDRDRTKRAPMGAIAASLADVVVLTSDNPRTEDPEQILNQVAAGFPPGFSAWVRQPDRRAAIRQALALGEPGDVVLLAGKGHETTQEIGEKRIPLEEREEIASFFQKNTV